MGERMPQVAVVCLQGSLSVHIWRGDSKPCVGQWTGLASGNKRPACAPSGTGFRAWLLEMNYCGRASVYTPELFLRSREAVAGRGG